MCPEIEQVLPKYLQVANHIRDLILSGELRPGDEVPSERQIADQWHVSRPTATRALGALRAEGLVDSRQGSGTYVRERPALSRRARDRYSRSRATGRAYTADERSEIVQAGVAPAPDAVAAALAIDRGAPAIHRCRIIFEGDEPVEVSTSWFADELAAAAPDLLKRARIREGTVAYIERATGRRARLGRDRVTARLATAEESDALSLGTEPCAVLLVHHTAFDANARALEFSEAVLAPGRWMLDDEYPIPG